MMRNNINSTNEEDIQMIAALRQLRQHFLNGEFRAAHSMLTKRLIGQNRNPDQLHLFNVCLIYTMHKLKEF